MTNNTVISPVYPMLIQKYNTLIPDPNANVLDKINTIIDYLNQTGKLTNDVVNQWNQVMAWAMNDGLNTDVSNKLETMLSSGEFDTLFQKYIAPSLGDIKTLQTNDKISAVNAINEVDQLAKTNQTNLGTLSNLTTTDKSSLVNAVNEADNLAKSNQGNIGTLANLQTVDKGNLVAAINDNVAQLVDIVTIDIKNPGYGLTACKGDGTTDDTVALQAIVNKITSIGKGILYFPAGTYIISNTITICNNTVDTSLDITFRGQESISSVIQASGNSTAFDLFLIKTTGGNVRFLNFEKLFFSFGQNGIHGYQYSYSYIKDCMFMNQSNAGIYVEHGMLLRIQNNHFLNTLNTQGTGVYISGLMGGAYGNHIITNNTFGEALYNGVIDTGYGSIIANNQFYWIQNVPVRINGDCHKIYGNMFTGFGSTGGQGVYILYGNKNEVYNNIFDNSQNNDNGAFTSPAVAAIYLVSALDTKISQNQILATTATLSNGIVINNASDRVVIFDNFFNGVATNVYNQNASAIIMEKDFDFTNKLYHFSGVPFKIDTLLLGSISSLPTASATYENQFAIVEGNGTSTASIIYICLKSSTGTYSWKQLISG